jgi:DNA-nicking Smr family endonuclease
MSIEDDPDGGLPDDPVRLPLDGTLDLHTFAPSEVGTLVPEWIEASRAAGLHELRIVHGKGTGALRRSVEALLARHPLVASFRPAGEDGGGWGATLVKLR